MPTGFQELRDIDARTKPSGADDEWTLADAYYHDQSRATTVARLRQLGLGLAGNTRPLEVSLLRRVVDRLATIYDRAPTRWLTLGGTRLPEDDSDHRAMDEVLRRAQYNLAWRHVDRTRALLRQAVIRVYPSDPRRSTVVRVFQPHNVMREVDAGSPDTMDTDRQFALCLAVDPEIWEWWTRTDDGWHMQWVDERGDPLDDERQPLVATGFVCPYRELPVQIVYDDYSGGRAWIPPRNSRSSWVEAINAMSNDLWNLVVHEAHDTKAVSTDSPEEVPSEHGPGKAWALPRDATVSVLTGNPKIAESKAVLNNCVRLWTLSEDLPTSEFDDAKQVVTGAALRVQQGPLLARREAQVPLAEEDERQAWRRLRSVHNVHASTWNVARLREDTEMDVEIGQVHLPVDQRELLDVASRSLALGTRSVIDVIQEQANVDRPTAIRIYERVAADREAYPIAVGSSDLAAMQDGPRLADVAEPGDGREMAQSPRWGEDVAVSGADSVVGRLKGIS
jgi:hypothetical protein